MRQWKLCLQVYSLMLSCLWKKDYEHTNRLWSCSVARTRTSRTGRAWLILSSTLLTCMWTWAPTKPELQHNNVLFSWSIETKGTQTTDTNSTSVKASQWRVCVSERWSAHGIKVCKAQFLSPLLHQSVPLKKNELMWTVPGGKLSKDLGSRLKRDAWSRNRLRALQALLKTRVHINTQSDKLSKVAILFSNEHPVRIAPRAQSGDPGVRAKHLLKTLQTGKTF